MNKMLFLLNGYYDFFNNTIEHNRIPSTGFVYVWTMELKF